MNIGEAKRELIKELDNGKLQIRVQATNANIDFFENIIRDFEEKKDISNCEMSRRLSNSGTIKYKREFIKTEMNLKEE